MDILSLSFEEPLIISIGDTRIKLIPFQTHEYGHIKFGIDAPRSINVHREEIYKSIQSKQQSNE